MGILDTVRGNKEVEQKAAAMDAIVTQKNAEELVRQEFGRMKAAEAASILNQGLAARSIPYNSDISEEDAYRLQLANQAAQANAARQSQQMDPAIMDMINKNRAYNEANSRLKEQPMTFDQYPVNEEATISNYQNSVDQGLADRWAQSYKGR